jgi:DNA-directed RNA polymerase subunit H (RpoH/RPB5)
MNLPHEISSDLENRLALGHELLNVVEREGQSLRQSDSAALFEFYQLRKNLLPRLNQSLDTLRKHRVNWQKCSPEERARHPEISMLLRQNQDLTMKIILLDRENEQSLLRRGLVPARELPSVNRQRPHFVANMYRRQAAPVPAQPCP